MLPRIKYRNPSVPISIARHNDPDGPSLLHIYMRSTTTSSPTTDTDSAPPTHTLNIRDQQDSQILDALVKTVGATQIETTAQEKQEIADMKELRERGERDRVEVREKLIKERRELELLKMARGEVPVAA
jgi:large subunit ribosomal protein MRP49